MDSLEIYLFVNRVQMSLGLDSLTGSHFKRVTAIMLIIFHFFQGHKMHITDIIFTIEHVFITIMKILAPSSFFCVTVTKPLIIIILL